MKNKYGKILLGVTTALALVGCGTDDGGSSADDSLVIYSNSVSDGRGDWLKERAAEEGYDLEIVDSGGGETFNRLIAEKNATQADITFGLDETYFSTLKEEDMLREYVPAWVDEVPEETLSGEGYYHPTVEQRIYMMYNPEFLSEEDAPSNWQDLGNDEKYANQYRVPVEFDGGTNQKAALSILLQYKDPDAELGIAEEGWEELEKWLDNGYGTPESEDDKVNFAEGKVPINYYYSSGIPELEETFDFKSVAINPDQGVITMREQIGILDKGDNHDYSTTEEFVEWFGSAELQGEWAEKFGSLPVNEKAVERALPRMQEIAENTTPMDVDWDFVAEYIDLWIEKIELEIL